MTNSGMRRRMEAASCRGVKLMELMLYTRRFSVLGLALRRSEKEKKEEENRRINK